MSRSALLVEPEPFSGHRDLIFEVEIRKDVEAKNHNFGRKLEIGQLRNCYGTLPQQDQRLAGVSAKRVSR